VVKGNEGFARQRIFALFLKTKQQVYAPLPPRGCP